MSRCPGPVVPQREKHKEFDFGLRSRWPRRCPVVPQREKHKEFDFSRRSRWPHRCPVVPAQVSQREKHMQFDFGVRSRWPCHCPAARLTCFFLRARAKGYGLPRAWPAPRKFLSERPVAPPLSRCPKGKNIRNLTLASEAGGPAVVPLSRPCCPAKGKT